jgi:transposase
MAAHQRSARLRTEGVNTDKMLKRQMYGRAGFTLLRCRILLG